MSFQDRTNLAYSTIPSGGAPSPTGSGSSLKVASAADRATFPTPPFMATVWPSGVAPTLSNAEIVQINGTTSTDGFTMVRAQGGTTAKNIVAGWQIAATVTITPFDDIEAAITQRTFVTVSTATGSDYVCDGLNDDIEINAAITAMSSSGGGEVKLRQGTYYISATISPKNGVRLIGAGKQKTIIKFGGGAPAGNLMTAGSNPMLNVEVAHITFDAGDKLNAGIFNCSVPVQSTQVHDCEFLNVNCPTSSHWPLRLGVITDADVSGSASYNVNVYNNLFSGNDCGTFEVILLPNVRQSHFHHNKFINNSTSATSEVSWYSQNFDCKYSENIHIDWSDRALNVTEATRVDVVNNTFTNTTANITQVAVRLSNLASCKFSGNNIYMAVGNQGYGVNFQDNNVGRDGHAQVNPNSLVVDISDNVLTNTYYGIAGFALAASNFSYKDFSITNNKFYNCAKSPIRFGPNSSGLTMDIQNIFVRNNIVYSWSGVSEGAISFYGDTSDATKMKNIFIEDNFVANNTTGNPSGAIRISGCTVETILRNYIYSTGSYTSISFLAGGTANFVSDNIGHDGLSSFTTSTSSTSTSSTSTSSTSSSISTSSTSFSTSSTSSSISTSSTSHSTSSTSTSHSTSSTSTSTTVIAYS